MTHNETMPSPGEAMPPYTDDNRADLLIGTISGFLAFTLIFVALRIYVRAIVLKKWGPDDTLVVISYVRYVVSAARRMLSNIYLDIDPRDGRHIFHM